MRAALRVFLLRVRWHLASEEGQPADSPLRLLLLTGAVLAGLAALAIFTMGSLSEAIARAIS